MTNPIARNIEGKNNPTVNLLFSCSVNDAFYFLQIFTRQTVVKIGRPFVSDSLPNR